MRRKKKAEQREKSAKCERARERMERRRNRLGTPPPRRTPVMPARTVVRVNYPLSVLAQPRVVEVRGRKFDVSRTDDLLRYGDAILAAYGKTVPEGRGAEVLFVLVLLVYVGSMIVSLFQHGALYDIPNEAQNLLKLRFVSETTLAVLLPICGRSHFRDGKGFIQPLCGASFGLALAALLYGLQCALTGSYDPRAFAWRYSSYPGISIFLCWGCFSLTAVILMFVDLWTATKWAICGTPDFRLAKVV